MKVDDCYNMYYQDRFVTAMTFPQGKKMTMTTDIRWMVLRVYGSAGNYECQMLMNERLVDEMMEKLQELKREFIELRIKFHNDLDRCEDRETLDEDDEDDDEVIE